MFYLRMSNIKNLVYIYLSQIKCFRDQYVITSESFEIGNPFATIN